MSVFTPNHPNTPLCLDDVSYAPYAVLYARTTASPTRGGEVSIAIELDMETADALQLAVVAVVKGM